MKKNIEWLSALKAFGITVVILGHMNNPFNDFIFSWHMPLFFMMAGFFIKSDGDFTTLIKKDIKRLMLPYFMFSVFAIVVESLKRFGLHRESLDYFQEFQSIFIWMDMKHLITSYAFVLWFLPTLFFSKLIYYALTKNINNVFLQASVFVLLFLMSFTVQLPFALHNAFNCGLWVFIGSFIFRVGGLKSWSSKSVFERTSMMLLSLTAVCSIYFFSGIPHLNLSMLTYEHPFLSLIWSVSVLMILVNLLAWFTQYKGLNQQVKLWGASTMFLFILHPYTNNAAYLLVQKISFGDWPLQLMVSVGLLRILLIIKQRYSNAWLFKYV